MFQALDKPSTESVSGSEFSASSYRTNNTEVTDYKLNKDGSVDFSPVGAAHSPQGYYNFFQQQPRYYNKEQESESEEDSEEEEDEDDDEDDSSDDSDESEESDSEDDDRYAQWREYYNNMYRSSMYGMYPYMNYMMNPSLMQMMSPQMMGQMNPQMMFQMQQMMMNPMMAMMGQMGQMGQNGMGQNVSPMNQDGTTMNGTNMNMMNGMNMNGMNINGMNMNGMNGMNFNPANQMNMNAANQMNQLGNNMGTTSQASATDDISPMNLNKVTEPTDSSPETPTPNKTRTVEPNSTSELIKNSRKSTIKSNRYSSMPSSIIEDARDRTHKRSTSMTPNFKESPTEDNNSFEHIDRIEGVAYGLSDLKIGDNEEGEAADPDLTISQAPVTEKDNRPMLPPKTEDQKSKSKLTKQTRESTTETPQGSDPHQLQPPDDSVYRSSSTNSSASYDSIASGSSSKFRISHKSNKSLDTPMTSTDHTPMIHQAPPITPPPKDLSMQADAETTEADETVVIKDQKKKKTKNKTKKSKHKKSLPPQSPGSNFSGFSTPSNYTDPSTMSNFSVPMDMQSMSSMSSNADKRHSIATADSKRQSMMMNNNMSRQMNPMMMSPPMNAMNAPFMNNMNMGGMQQMNYGGSPQMTSQMNPQMSQVSPSQPKSQTSPEIARRVEEFKQLRQIIASGNKSYEYRLAWVKMLINATNYKLYTLINIKGEPVTMNDAAVNKALFVKSANQHIIKLVRDLDVKGKITDEVKSDICLIYANLLNNHYQIYGQSFNVEKNVAEAIRYYEMAIQFNGSNSKALYNLGDLYEFDMPEQFNTAISYYRQSAKLGYNKAIYKMALLYLNVSSVRSIKYMKILRDLSNIDVEKSELIGEDKEELQEIVGFSCYELGKIYEGIYPGDLKINDEFIVKSLEIAPVNYAKSLTFYNKAAKLNCLLAQVKLGKVYEFGELNRAPNANKSIQWYMKAVNSPLSFKRHPDAMVGLSRWYLNGSEGQSKHIPKSNPDRALKWCDRALREFNTPEAYYQMGQLAEVGLSDRAPNYWYQRAAEMNFPPAIEKLQTTPA